MRQLAALNFSAHPAHKSGTRNTFNLSVLLTTLLMLCTQVATAQDTIYWDGGNTAQNGSVDGGDGTWDDVSTNWTNVTGTVNITADATGALSDRRFSGTAGTVNVAVLSSLSARARRLQFSTSGYRMEGAAIDVQGPLVLDANTSTTIANAFTATGLTSASTSTLIVDATGQLQFGTGGTGTAISGKITNNGVLVFNRSDDIEFTDKLNGAGLVRQKGTGVLTFNRPALETYSGNVEVTSGTFRPYRVEILGVVTLDGGTLSRVVTGAEPGGIELKAGGGTIEAPAVTVINLGNNISGAGKLTKIGLGELRMSGNKTFSGGLDVDQGFVRISDHDNSATSPLGTGPMTLAANTTLYLYSAVTVPNMISLVDTSALRVRTGFSIALSGDINFGGSSGVLILSSASSLGTADQTLNFSGVLSNGGFNVDAGLVTKGTPILEFSGTAANTYSGLTRIETAANSGLRFRLNKSNNVVAVPGDLTVDAGTQVIVVAHEQIADAATVQLDASAIMTLGDATAVTETVSILNGTGALGLTSLSEIRIGSGSFGGVISGDGSLVKQGSGTLVLSGASTYTGSTSVAAGQLQVSGSLVSGVTVASGATLSGAGTVGTLQVAAGANVVPGASAGTLSTGNLTLAATSVVNMELAAPGTVGGGVNDLIQVTGNLVLDGVLNVSNLGGLAVGTYTLMTYTGTLTNNGLTINTTPAGFVYSLDTTSANAIKLVVAAPKAAFTLSNTELDFGTRSINAAATTQTLTVSSSGDIAVNVGSITVSGDHAAEFSITADTCSNTALVVGADCTVTISQTGATSGLRTAALNIPSDAHDNPHAVSLKVHRVGLPTLTGLDGSSRTFHIGGSALRLDPNGTAVIGMPDALNLDGATLQVEMITGGNAAEDVFSFANVGGVSLSGTSAGSNVLVDGIVIASLDNAIAAGAVLSVTFNNNATVARVQALMHALTYQNLNAGSPVNGVRNARATLSYLGQSVAATMSIDVQPQPVEPPPPPPPPPAVLTGTISGDIAGDEEKPVTIRDATVTAGTSLTHVIIGSDVLFESGVTLGSGVIFEAPGIIQSIQNIGTFVIDGATITQLANGQLSIVAENYLAMLKPVEIVQATAGQASGVYLGSNADVYLITASGLGIRAYAVHVDSDSLQSILSSMALQHSYSSTGRMLVNPVVAEPAAQQGGTINSLQSEQVYFSGRSDVIAVSANRGDKPGLVEYAVTGLGNVRRLSSLFAIDDSKLMQQDVAPAPANWPELQEALLTLDGVTAAGIDARGIVRVSVDDIHLQGVMDYTVVRAADSAPGAMSLDKAGDLSGNGMSDYLVTYTNGDKQILFVYLSD